jgi:Ca2+-binding RTX toxin-like protein
VIGQSYTVRVDPYGTGESTYDLSINTPVGGPLSSTTANEIFINQGGGDVYGSFDLGTLRVMADFSKGAYSLSSWEESTDFNDISNGADDMINRIVQQGWSLLDLGPVFSAGATNNQMSSGVYTNGNAAALVAQSNDSLVISIRGTNDNREPDSDNGIINPSDPDNSVHPDKDHWLTMRNHYALLQPLITALDEYVDANQNINQVYVTGHSLGGAMAIQFMGTHPGDMYSAITFAAPGFVSTAGTGGGAYYDDTARVTHIEIFGDPVPDIGLHGGRTIHFEGDETASLLPNSDYHSMDYYSAITDNLDAGSWQSIIQESGDQTVLLGGSRTVSSDRTEEFTVGTANDTLTDPLGIDYDIYFGGAGTDTITGDSHAEILIGGAGNDSLTAGRGDDTLIGGSGSDTLTGNGGNDIFKFVTPTDGEDTITDFSTGAYIADDQIHVVADNFGLNPGESVDLNSGNRTSYIGTGSQFLYIPVHGNGYLYFDQDGTGSASSVLLATLTGAPSLTSDDILVVAG